jgi:hypothetical protein
MRVPAQMPSQRGWVLPQRQFRMSVKKVANAEQTEKEWPLQWQPDTERYLLQITGRRSGHSRRPKLRKPWHWKSKPGFQYCRSRFMTV